MDQHDRDNLNFLLSASSEVLLDWYNHVDDDDVVYALELLNFYKLELIDQAAELSELREANEVLSYIMEK
jgi:hypothetical protein